MDHGVLLRGRRWLEEGGKTEGRQAQAQHPHTSPGAKAQQAPAACVLAGALPGCPGAACGFAGKCLPLSLVYFGGCSANSLLSRGTAMMGFAVAGAVRSRSWERRCLGRGASHHGHRSNGGRLRTPSPPLLNGIS